jgi:hypothetical protein
MALLRHGIVSALAALLVSINGAASGAIAPEVEAFDVEQVAQLSPGTRLNFSLYGTPLATATLTIEGAAHDFELREVQPGVYEGTYVIDAQDRIAPDARVSATLRLGSVAANALLEEALLLGGERPVAAAAPPPVPRAVSPPLPVTPGELVVKGAPIFVEPAPIERHCDDCAVVESIQAVPPRRRPHGGMLGPLVDALEDTLSGRSVEPRPRTLYEVVLRRPGGSGIVRTYDQRPAFKVGDTIQLGINMGGARSERLALPPNANWRAVSSGVNARQRGLP